MRQSGILRMRSQQYRSSMVVKAAARCLCCGYRTLEQPESLSLCPVCWWMDEGQDDADADAVWESSNGKLSLAVARINFMRFGAADPRHAHRVRPPRADEAVY